MLDLQRALQAIEQGEGYHHTVASSSVKLDPNDSVEQLRASNGQRPFVLIEYSDDAPELAEKPSGLQIVLPLTVHWIGESDAKDDASLLRTFFEGCADIEKAIAVDVSRGGRASNTQITSRRLTFEGSEVWAEVGVAVRLRRSFGEPNE